MRPECEFIVCGLELTAALSGAENEEEFYAVSPGKGIPVEDGMPYTIGKDFYLGERYSPRLISFQDVDGTVYTEEVSEEEFQRHMTGQGSTPERDYAYDLHALFEELDRVWENRVAGWWAGDNPNIILSEN